MVNASALSIHLRVSLASFELDVELDSDARRLGIFGPSGAGKTTLLESVAGWRAVRSGRIVLGGRVLYDGERGLALPIEQRGLGYVPQEGLLFPHRNVRANLEAGSARARQGTNDVEALLRRVVEVLELGVLLERASTTLSGGERQRVALGRALCSGPAALLLDEPLAGLDLPLRRRILPYLVRVGEEFDLPMLFVSHDPTEVAVLCDEVALLERGRITACGRPADLFAARWRRDESDGDLHDDALQNVLRGSVIAAGADVARVALGPASGPASGLDIGLEVSASELVPGTEVVLGIGADEILVATRRPEGLSARNVLNATIVSLDPASRGVVLRATLGPRGPALDVLLTQASTRTLQLAPGGAIFLVLKSNAVRVLAAL